ncbi:MAG: biotin synthase BioB [Schwartzia sp.]|nr:biotin synthase BioB [Schwartzia sp. (in: firmicutes)]
MSIDISELARKIIYGYRVKRGDDLSIFLDADLEELQKGAGEIQRHFRRNHIDLCTIINGRSGRCPENCKYCAQAACHKTGIEEYGFLPKDEIIAEARKNQEAGVNRFAIVTAGRALKGKDFDKAIEVFEEMHRTLTIDLCASMGFLDAEQFHRLHMAGVTSYHHNIETSRRFFPEICTTHTYDDKIRTIKLAQAEGLCVCSGGIIGMGENWEDRLDMAISLAELGIESIPINALMPIPGTALEGRPQISGDDVLRTIAFFRFINPESNIRLAAGRKVLPECGATAFLSGASATITGDMLTTSGTTIKGDFAILKRLGLTNEGSNEIEPEELPKVANA